jgi:1,4-alpha-glucan branching enzyme
MYAHPGKKLLFMGDEFAAVREWDHDAQLDWDLLGDPLHAGVARLVRDCNRAYRSSPALHDLDSEPQGFEWIDFAYAADSVLAFSRQDRGGRRVVAVINATPVVRRGYRIGVPQAGTYRETINTDSHYYGGSNVGNGGAVASETIAAHGRPHSIVLTLPPLAALLLTHDDAIGEPA